MQMRQPKLGLREDKAEVRPPTEAASFIEAPYRRSRSYVTLNRPKENDPRRVLTPRAANPVVGFLSAEGRSEVSRKQGGDVGPFRMFQANPFSSSCRRGGWRRLFSPLPQPYPHLGCSHRPATGAMCR